MMFDLINNAIAIGFALLLFPVGPFLICWGSNRCRSEYVERDWRVG